MFSLAFSFFQWTQSPQGPVNWKTACTCQQKKVLHLTIKYSGTLQFVLSSITLKRDAGTFTWGNSWSHTVPTFWSTETSPIPWYTITFLRRQHLQIIGEHFPSQCLNILNKQENFLFLSLTSGSWQNSSSPSPPKQDLWFPWQWKKI